MMKKLLILLAVFSFCFSLSLMQPRQAHANFLTDYFAETVEGVVSNLGDTTRNVIYRAAAVGVDASVRDIIAANEKNSPTAYYGPGIITSMSNYTMALMNRPVKSADYVAYVIHNTVPQAYAQGVGFAGLSPILSIWQAFRNMVYFLFIIIFVIIGFMIMFRAKIDAHTVISIQEALPKIIVTLLLVTFSYAIAGFVVDLMYFVILASAYLFEQAGLITSAKTAVNTLFSRNIIAIGLHYFTGFTEPAGQAAEAMGQLISQVVGGLLGAIGNVIFYLIFVIAIIIAIFRTFIQLVLAYVGIIIQTIFAPVLILPNAFPGNKAFENWLRGLIANAAVFPVACVFVLIGATIAGKSIIFGFGGSASQNGLGALTTTENIGFKYEGFIPPLLGNGTSPGGSVNVIKALIGFGMIMLLPEVIKYTHELFAYKQPWYGEAAMKNASAGNVVWQWPRKQIANRYAEYKQREIMSPGSGGAAFNLWDVIIDTILGK